MPGYGGDACQRQLCGHEKCNDHGVCMSIANVYTLFTIGANESIPYDAWDGDQVTMCVCYAGYTGPACEMSKFMCSTFID